MGSKQLHKYLLGVNNLIDKHHRVMNLRLLSHRSGGGLESHDQEEEQEDLYSSELYEKAFSKMKKWSHSLKGVDLVGGRLVDVIDYSRVYDDKLERKMLAFKAFGRVLIGHPTVRGTMRKNMMDLSHNRRNTEFLCFRKRHEKEAVSVNSLRIVAEILGVSVPHRKEFRQTIYPHVTQHRIWTSTLEEILNGLKSEIDVLVYRCPRKEIKLAHQIVVGCLKFLDNATSYDPESTSWMRLTPTKGDDSSDSSKWEDVLEMFFDLTNCLRYENELACHVTKVEAMKEGLYQIRDVLIDRNIGYKENRYQEHLEQKLLTNKLGYPSQCFFTLLLYYLYSSVRDVGLEVRGGLHAVDGGKFCFYTGKILASDEEQVIRNALKELNRSLSLFKFVWEAANMKGDLVVQGHMWCPGSDNRSIPYKGNMFLLHGINL